MEAAGRTLCTAQVATLTITNIYVLLSASIIRHSSTVESVHCLFLVLFPVNIFQTHPKYFCTHRFLRTLRVVGWMQLVDQVVLPPSLQMEMENRPKFARTRLMSLPSSHSMSRVEPSHPYLVRRSDPGVGFH